MLRDHGARDIRGGGGQNHYFNPAAGLRYNRAFDAVDLVASLPLAPFPDARTPPSGTCRRLDPNAAIPGFRAAWERAEVVLKWAAVLLGCSIPISVAVDNILLGVILFFWLAGGGYRHKLAAIRGNPVAWMALALFGLFVVGSLYSIGPPQDVLDALVRRCASCLSPR